MMAAAASSRVRFAPRPAALLVANSADTALWRDHLTQIAYGYSYCMPPLIIAD
ncbi:hypothetical protein GGE07_005413 [Sinorhizobium terangae]|nr:hypothetical protein [Sinorhizobium terangae]